MQVGRYIGERGEKRRGERRGEKRREERGNTKRAQLFFFVFYSDEHRGLRDEEKQMDAFVDCRIAQKKMVPRTGLVRNEPVGKKKKKKTVSGGHTIVYGTYYGCTFETHVCRSANISAQSSAPSADSPPIPPGAAAKCVPKNTSTHKNVVRTTYIHTQHDTARPPITCV